MAGSDGKPKLLAGSRKWAWAALAVALFAMIVLALRWKDLRVAWVLSDLDDEPEATAEALRKDLSLPYKAELREAYLEGGRRFSAQVYLGKVLAQDPFYMSDTVREAMDAEDAEVRRAAAVTFLEISFDPRTPPGRMDDRALEVFEEWAAEPAHASLFLFIQRLGYYDDERLAEPLAEILASEAPQDSLDAIGRSNRNREASAKALKRYADREIAMDAFRTVIERDEESDMVQAYALQGLGRGGGGDDPELWGKAARSDSTVKRQVAASNLRYVEGAWAVPLLLRLSEDVNNVVRREAIDSIAEQGAPEYLDHVHYWAEDSWDSIRGDLPGHLHDLGVKDHTPLMAWILREHDPLVVEKAYVALVKTTNEHHGLTDEKWDVFKSQMRRRAGIMKELMVDEERKEEAILEWSGGPDRFYTDEDRVPHLIRQLRHAARENVERAMNELARITGRREGFPPALFRDDLGVEKEANEWFRFMESDREKLSADWKRWWEARK